MVNEKLLSRIVNKDVRGITYVPYIPEIYDEGFSYTTTDGVGHFINIYELCYMGKKWARGLGYKLESRVTQTMNGACKITQINTLTEKLHKTEIGAILDSLKYVYNRVYK